MPSLTTLATFVLVVTAFAAVPGPSNLYVVAQGLRAGRRPAVAAAVGCALAAATYVAATTLGLAALLAHTAAVLAVLHYVGGIYLLYLGIRAWRSAGRLATESDRHDAAGHDGDRPRRALVQGFVVELSNPKVALFFLALFPQFVHRGDGSVTGQLLVLGVLFCVIGLLSDLMYAMASGTIRKRVGGNKRPLVRATRGSALLYVGLGCWSIWSGARVRAAS